MLKQYSVCSEREPGMNKRKHISLTFLNITFEDDIKSCDPLLEINVILTLRVEVFEDPVHDDVLCHVKFVMKKLPKFLPINFSTMIITFLEDDQFYHSNTKYYLHQNFSMKIGKPVNL